MASKLVVFLSVIYQVNANCAAGTSLFPRVSNDGSLNSRSEKIPIATFNYDNVTGPLDWYQLNKTANEACDKGTHQSPIVINANSGVDSVAGSTFKWTVDNYPKGTEFENLGSTVEVIVNGSLVDDTAKKTYNLKQFHFHTPSEHRLEDEYFPMEMHWVHESSDHKIAVIGFLIELCEGRDCGEPVLKRLFSKINDIKTPGTVETSEPLDLSQIVSKFGHNSVYRYSGSLTTPPCAEGVEWIISKQILYIDLQSYLAVKKVVRFNSRYTQNKPGNMNLLLMAAKELCEPSRQNSSQT